MTFVNYNSFNFRTFMMATIKDFKIMMKIEINLCASIDP